MGFVNVVSGFAGFGVGLFAGIVIGYCLFIYFRPSDVKDPKIHPLIEYDTQSLGCIFPEVPLWVKNPDYERIDWLNKFLVLMWPYLNEAICRTAKRIAEPIIAENILKYKINSVEFETLTLGSLPPTCDGIKVYITEEKELIIQPSLKWAGNPNFIVVVKAFGLRLTVQVVDLQIFVIPRITLKPLVPSFPCFAKILVSLMEKPHVDFGLKLMGADLMSIPGLYRFVQETIKNQVANMYLWPKTLEVPVLDVSKASTKPVGILLVKVIRAYKLKKKDLLGKSDPYVKLKLSDDKFQSKKTSVKYNDLNPQWNQEFKFVIRDPEKQYLELNVYDWEQVGKHEKMGMNIIRLNELTPNVSKTLTLHLLKNLENKDLQSDKSRGEIVVEAMYKPLKEEDVPKDVNEKAEVEKAPDGTPSGGGLLVVIVHEAQDLEGKHHTNPYVKITFRGEEKKTKHIKKNRDPRWEEEFQFVCEEPPVNDKMQVEVFSKAPSIGIYPKEKLGFATISLEDVVNNKRTNERSILLDHHPSGYSTFKKSKYGCKYEFTSSCECSSDSRPHNYD
ncbi:synaptotagmin-2 [Canna indica]|uniref:Synaptotagmin-2 n=1 Tax=Canna indica TaxID=4628 RepID=A0AAQ3L177_9LILI|nr:synaptotagmin-2 [Canna indica]